MGRQCQSFPANIGADRQLPVADIEQHRQTDGRRAAEIEQFIHGSADGAAGHQHVIDQDQIGAVHVERQVGRLHRTLQAAGVEVVPVEAHVQTPQRQGRGQPLVEGFRHPGAAGLNAHQ